MDRKKYIALLQEKGYKVVNEGQVMLGSKVFDVFEGPQETAMGVQDAFWLKLHSVDKDLSVDDRLAYAEARSKDAAKSYNVKVLSFVDDVGYTQFSVDAGWYELQENKADIAALFERAIFDEDSGFRDLTGKYWEPEI